MDDLTLFIHAHMAPLLIKLCFLCVHQNGADILPCSEVNAVEKHNANISHTQKSIDKRERKEQKREEQSDTDLDTDK